MLWYVLINAAGDPASISSAPITNPPAGWTVTEIESAGQPNVGEWWDPVAANTVMVGKTWDRTAKAWTTMLTPQVVDRIEDLVADPALVAAWQRLTVDQRTALRTRLAALLGRRRYRYLVESINLED